MRMKLNYSLNGHENIWNYTPTTCNIKQNSKNLRNKDNDFCCPEKYNFNNFIPKKNILNITHSTKSTHLISPSNREYKTESPLSDNSKAFLKIDPDNILEGIDQRTTIMLANIPNKYTLPMLLSLIDETSFGTYTFVYLRMDFINNCNVGYAFIDFATPLDLLEFYTACHRKSWIRFQSNKITNITYATIQGDKNLIQKFRRSKVMDQQDGYKPVIFNTQGIFKGMPKTFF